MKKIPLFFLLFFIVFVTPVFGADNSSEFVMIVNTTSSQNYFYSDSPILINSNGNAYSLTGIHFITNGSSFNYLPDDPINLGKPLTDTQYVTNIESNHDVKFYDGTVFFSLPKGLIPELEKIPVLEQILLPIRGILPYLIPFLILLVAFWKGWQFLLQQLRTA